MKVYGFLKNTLFFESFKSICNNVFICIHIISSKNFCY